MADQATVWRWTAPRPLYSVMRIAATRPRHRTQMSRRQGNARATHLDSRMVPSGRRAGRAPDHGRFASSPRAVVAVVVVVISCRASTGQSIGSRMTWDGSSRTPGAREEGRGGNTNGTPASLPSAAVAFSAVGSIVAGLIGHGGSARRGKASDDGWGTENGVTVLPFQ